MLKENQELKGLQSQLTIKESKIASKKAEIGDLQRELNALQVSRDKIKEKINRIKPKTELRVTEHSLLRYLERSLGVDLQEVERMMLEDPTLLETRKILDTDGKFPLKDGSRAIIKNSTIVTIEK